MKKALKIVAIILLAGFVVIQFFRPDFTNPPVTEAETLESATTVPENVDAILKRSCYDCHSNATVNPWYSKIQPSAWFLKNHIDDARRQVNFSVWNTYDVKKKRHKLEEVCEQLESKAMPLPSYLWIHWDAKLSDDQRKTVCDWATAERARLQAEQ
jgi:hypothetical protein